MLFFEIPDDSNDTIEIAGEMIFDTMKESLYGLKLKMDSFFDNFLKLEDICLS